MNVLRRLSMAIVLCALLAWSSVSANALRAGTVTLRAGETGVIVYFNTPLSWATQYVVSIQPVNSSGFSPIITYCMYFDVNSKGPYGFQIQLKDCDLGLLYEARNDVQLDWIIQEAYNPSY